MPDIVQPPDMVGAGMMQPPTDPSSVMDALRSQGNMPAGIMGMLAPPQTAGQAGASALAGGVAAMRGQPNPVMQQQAQFHQQQMQQAQMLERIQERRQAEQNRKNQMVIQVTTDALRHTQDPATKSMLAKQLESLYKQGGMQIPSAVSATWSETGPLSKDDLQSLGQKIASGVYSDEYLQGEFERKGLPRSQYEQTKKFLSTNPGRQAAGLPTREQDEINFNKYRESKGKALDAVHPEVGRGTSKGDAAAEYFLKTRGKPIIEMDDTNPVDVRELSNAIAAGKKAEVAETLAKHAWEEHKILLREAGMEARQAAREAATEKRALAHMNQLPLAGQWVDTQTGALLSPTKAEFAADPRKYRNVGTQEAQMIINATTALEMTHRLGDLVDTLVSKHGATELANSLVEPGLLGQAKQAVIGAGQKTLRNDPNWGEFHNLMTELNIELARVVGGGGQLRVTVMDRLREAGLKGWETPNTGHRILNTIETSIWNRRESAVKGANPAALRQYGSPSTPAPPPPGFTPVQR